MLKVAILAEKYAVDYTWYVDTILNLIRIAGDYVSEEVWYRVIQIVINRDDVQGYAAKTVFEVSIKIISQNRSTIGVTQCHRWHSGLYRARYDRYCDMMRFFIHSALSQSSCF